MTRHRTQEAAVCMQPSVYAAPPPNEKQEPDSLHLKRRCRFGAHTSNWQQKENKRYNFMLQFYSKIEGEIYSKPPGEFSQTGFRHVAAYK